MFTLDEIFFNETSDREIPEEINLQMISPARIVGGLLQKMSLQIDQHMLQNTLSTDSLLKTLAELAVKVFQAGVVLDHYRGEQSIEIQRMSEHLSLICKQMHDCIKEEGLIILDPKEKQYEDIKELVTVDGWVKSDRITFEQVLEVREPVIIMRAENRLLRKGSVVMGSPSRAGTGDEHNAVQVMK